MVRQTTGPDQTIIPYRHLAMCVLARALRDLSEPGRSPTDRESARLFLAGSPMLMHWCRVAALDPHRLTQHAATFTGGRNEIPAEEPPRAAPSRLPR